MNARAAPQHKILEAIAAGNTGTKLLDRFQFSRKTFYQEKVRIGDEFALALKEFIRTHGQAGAERTTGKYRSLLHKYVKRHEVQHLRLETYQHLAGVIGVTPWVIPDMVKGTYVGLLLAWYYDTVHPGTKNLNNPLPAAKIALLSTLARYDAAIRDSLAGGPAMRAAIFYARDLLRGEKACAPYNMVREYEEAVLNALPLEELINCYGCTEPSGRYAIYEMLRAGLKQVFRKTDPNNLRPSLESKFDEFVNGIIQNKPKPFLPRWSPLALGIKYEPGDNVMDPTLGEGVVVQTSPMNGHANNGPALPIEVLVHFHQATGQPYRKLVVRSVTN